MAKYKWARAPLEVLAEKWKAMTSEPEPLPSPYEVMMAQIREIGPVGLGLVIKFLSHHREACSQMAEQRTSYDCERALGASLQLRFLVAELEALAAPPATEPSEEP
jgi:hypothetical protein